MRAFWPLWSIIAGLAALLLLGLHDMMPVEAVWAVLGLAGVAGLAFAIRGARAFRTPRRTEALARMDAALPGRPLAALADSQAVGSDDEGSESLWRVHQARMADRAAQARAVEPDLKLSRHDPFGLRYVAVLVLIVGLMFGSVWRAGSVTQLSPGDGSALAGGPVWEGWIEPPGYTGKPSLYLADQEDSIRVPEGSRVTLRLYGEVGVLEVTETVSGNGGEDVIGPEDTEQAFDITQDGMLAIDGPGGQNWQVIAEADQAPKVELVEDGTKTTFDGQMSQPFAAKDDYGVTGGTATFRLDLSEVPREHGLAIEPEARDPIVLDLPMPVTGDRADFSETLVENLSQHAWAHLPVALELAVEDARGQSGASAPRKMRLPARRFFDPMASAVIEQRRDLLWSRENAKRVAQILRAVSHQPDPSIFRSETAYLKLGVIVRRLETMIEQKALTTDARDGIADALWDLAVQLEDGDIGDALERMRQAQERLSEAMRNGASDDEIAQLMQELRDATQDYLRQKSQQAQRDGEQDGDRQQSENAMQMTQQDLQDMMDHIQDLMEQGRMAEAQQALEEFQQMMENMRVTEGQGQQGQSPGQEAMEGLAETLRDQQGLSDQAFRNLQEQFNPDAQSGQSQGNEGRSGDMGSGETHEGQSGQGEGSGTRQGQGDPQQGEEGREGDLAERQRELRRQLENQRGNLPGAGSDPGDAARESLDRAGDAMEGAEEALRNDDLAEALDRQSEAMESMREGMRNLGEALAENRRESGEGQGQARGEPGTQQSDPLGRRPGSGGEAGTQDSLIQGDDVYRRARELLDEIRRRAGEGERPDVELDYLKRLLDRF